MPVGACTDGDACTGTTSNPDHCDGVNPDCIPGAIVVCQADGDPCTSDPPCDHIDGCVNPFVPTGTPCNPNDPGGTDNNPCTSDTCGGATQQHNCIFTGLAVGTPCETDTNECTIQTCQLNGSSYPVCTRTSCESTSHPCTICGTNCVNSYPNNNNCGCANS